MKGERVVWGEGGHDMGCQIYPLLAKNGDLGLNVKLKMGVDELESFIQTHYASQS